VKPYERKVQTSKIPKADPEVLADIAKCAEVHEAESKSAKKVVRWLNRLQQEARSTGGLSDATIREIAKANDQLTEAETIAAENLLRLNNEWFI